MSANKGPLSGIRVLDLGRHVSCPICAQTLGDLGAEVIKLEKTGWGDDTRHSGKFLGEQSMYFWSNNRNKKSVSVNFRTDEGKKLLHDLIEKSDIILENFRPGTMEKMGFGWEKVHEINPRIIMGSISGYGAGSPYQNRPGFDSMISAQSGIMDINKSESDGPKITGGIWFIDILAGMWTTIGVLSALHRRETTGVGEYIDTAMYDSALFVMNQLLPYAEKTGEISRSSLKNAYDCPAGRYRSKDGYVICLAGSDGLFQRLLSITDDPFLHDPKFADHDTRLLPEYYDAINEHVEQLMMTKTGDEWDEIFDKTGITGGKIKDLNDVLKDPASHSRNATVKLEVPGFGPVSFSGFPINMSGEEFGFTPAPAQVGQDTDEVLSTVLGRTAEEIAAYKASGN